MTRFGNTDNEFSRYLTGDTSLGLGDHIVTHKGVVGLITYDWNLNTWSVKVGTGDHHSARLISKDVCRPCIEVTMPFPGPRTAYMCNCGCEKMWMPTVDAWMPTVDAS